MALSLLSILIILHYKVRSPPPLPHWADLPPASQSPAVRPMSAPANCLPPPVQLTPAPSSPLYPSRCIQVTWDFTVSSTGGLNNKKCCCMTTDLEPSRYVKIQEVELPQPGWNLTGEHVSAVLRQEAHSHVKESEALKPTLTSIFHLWEHIQNCVHGKSSESGNYITPVFFNLSFISLILVLHQQIKCQ